MKTLSVRVCLLSVTVCLAAALLVTAQEKGKVIEEIVARVNNEIITRSDWEKARSSASEEARDECPQCTPEQLQNIVAERQKNALRDLIDQSLLVQRAKDMDINVEADVVRKLDDIRRQNKMPDMDTLEKAVTSSGIGWEDFKSSIRNNLLGQKVISEEVGHGLQVGHEEVQKYYEEHKKDFVRPEEVVLREIFVSTEGKEEAVIPELEKKAKSLRERVVNGEDFGELAQHFSDGSTAKDKGFLGAFKRGELSKEIEDAVFSLKKDGMTDVIRTKQGFLLLQVLEHYNEGEQPLDKVENEISDRLFGQKMEPAYRKYLQTLREESYVVVKPGYVDTGGGGNTDIQEVSGAAETAAAKSKAGHKRFLVFGKRKPSGT
jgi:peptidyl-prolyl cis-trans isomerase SurA